MKIELPRGLRRAWHVLTEVPGWPDAPTAVRLRRFMPILLPCAGMVALLLWRVGLHNPAVRSLHAQYAGVEELEHEVETLRLAWSEQQVADVAAQAATASRRLLERPEAAEAVLIGLREECSRLGWQGSFQTFEDADDPATGREPIRFLPVVGRLTHAPERADAFTNLVAIAERIHAHSTRFDLTRLQIRPDPNGAPLVEMSLRLGVFPEHEKTAE